MKKWIVIAILFASAASAQTPPEDREHYILRLEKRVAELEMELVKQEYMRLRALWKEKLKALGEPDPDEPPKESKK